MSELDANIIVDGQKVVATLAQSGDVIKDGGAIDATSVIQTDNGPQKVVKVMDINGGGGGGGGTVDQTYDPTSTNAQSGTAVAEAVAPALKNTSSATRALGILAQSVTNEGAIAIGNTTGTVNALATVIGTRATVNGGTGAIAIGGSFSNDYRTKANQTRAIAIGSSAYDTTPCQATAQDAIQLGIGTNNTDKTFQVYSYPMLDGTTGKIPMARLPIVQCTQAEYDALVAGGTVDANTIYCIIPA